MPAVCKDEAEDPQQGRQRGYGRNKRKGSVFRAWHSWPDSNPDSTIDRNSMVRGPFMNQEVCQAPEWWSCFTSQAHPGRRAYTFPIF